MNEGACAVRHFQVDNRCPLDRAVITAVNDNRNLREVVQIFLQQFPEHRLSTADAAEMDRVYQPGQSVCSQRGIVVPLAFY